MRRPPLRHATLTVVACLVLVACGSGEAAEEGPGVRTVSAAEAVTLIEDGEHTIIDVRTPEEYEEAHVVGSINIDVNGAGFQAGIEALDPETPYVVYCRSGNRSAQAAAEMEAAGIDDIADAGGLADLAREGAPVE